jgi:chaperonin GroES
MDDNGKIRKIDPIQYYTKFGFIPNPDGGFYDIGFGVLLGPLNESVNTVINQLLDSGHLATLQSGFIGKGLRIRMGDNRFLPGEWKAVNATGGDLKNQIVPLPTKEPSNVLFQLMGSLITSGKELASVAEIFVGKMPGQNTPATTTMATIEQGMKVFTAVYKRLYRSLKEEFLKLARLNNLYVNPNTYVDVVDMQVGPEDFDMTKHNIYPGADPTAVSQTEKLLKAQGLMELLPTGILDPVKVVSRVLDAQEQPNWQELLNAQVAQTGQVPQQPDPKMLEMQMKGQLEQQKIGMQSQAQQHKMELETRDKQVQLAMKAQEHALDMEHKREMANISAAEALHKQRIFSAQGESDLIQKLVHGEATHQQKMQHADQAAKQKAKEPSKGTKK